MKRYFLKPQGRIFKMNLFLWFIFLGLNANGQITKTIRGTLTDADTQEPLESATVFLSELSVGVSTWADGSFVIDDVPIGRYTLQASFVGYQTLTVTEVLLESGKELILELSLKKGDNNLSEIVVKAAVPRSSNEILPSSEILSRDETFRLPATFFDPARLTFAYAGINSVNDQANHMVIRGNSPNNMSWRLEGVEIVNPNHLTNGGTASDRPSQNGGGVNILSAQMLDNSILMRSNFSAEYGNALSGIMDMSLRKGNNKKHEFTGQLGIIGTDLSAEGPLKKSRGSSYLVNLRYSTLAILSDLGVDLGDEVIGYSDLSAQLNFNLKKGGKLKVFFITGGSSNLFEEKPDSLIAIDKDEYTIRYNSNFNLFGVDYNKRFKNDLFLKNTFIISGRKDRYRKSDFDSFAMFELPISQFNTDASRTSLKTTFRKPLDEKTKLFFGHNTTMILDGASTPVNSNPVSAFLFQPFIQFNTQFSSRFSVSAGLTHAYFVWDTKTKNHLDCRVSSHYNLNKKNSLGFAYGLNSQMPIGSVYVLEEWNPIDGRMTNEDLKFLRSSNFSLFYKKQINQKLLFKSEIYYQHLFNIPVSKDTLDSFSAINLFNDFDFRFLESKGTGRNYGLEISAQQSISKNLFWLANVSLYESKYKGSDGIERDTRFNGNYIFNFTIGKEFPYKNKKGKEKTLGINTRITAAGGMRYSPIDEVASELGGQTIYDDANAYSLQNKDYFKTDLRIYWKTNQDNYTSTLSLDIQNVTNRKNPSFQYYDTVLNRTEQQFQLGLIPILSYRISL